MAAKSSISEQRVNELIELIYEYKKSLDQKITNCNEEMTQLSNVSQSEGANQFKINLGKMEQNINDSIEKIITSLHQNVQLLLADYHTQDMTNANSSSINVSNTQG